jgi:dUTP pyrophosphatase
MIIDVKLLTETAKLPTKAYNFDAGLDLYADVDTVLSLSDSDSVLKISTGVSMAIPEGYCGVIMDRSGMGLKGVKVFGGVIDSAYRGDILVALGKLKTDNCTEKCQGDRFHVIKRGDKIAQMLILPVPDVHLQVVDSLNTTERNSKGFGSSDRKTV